MYVIVIGHLVLCKDGEFRHILYELFETAKAVPMTYKTYLKGKAALYERVKEEIQKGAQDHTYHPKIDLQCSCWLHAVTRVTDNMRKYEAKAKKKVAKARYVPCDDNILDANNTLVGKCKYLLIHKSQTLGIVFQDACDGEIMVLTGDDYMWEFGDENNENIKRMVPSKKPFELIPGSN